MNTCASAIPCNPRKLLVLALVSCGALLSVCAACAAERYAFAGRDWLAPATALPTWHAAVVRQHAQRREFQPCLDDPSLCVGARRSLQHVLSRARTLNQEQQVRLVNSYVNHRRYRTDRRQADPLSLLPNKRLRSHWSTLFEFLSRGGDCEDFASAKYFLLRELGFAADDLRIVVTRELRARGNHALVAIRLPDQAPDQRVWLLDTDKIYRHYHSQYRFRYALNESSIWDHEVDSSRRSVSTIIANTGAQR